MTNTDSKWYCWLGTWVYFQSPHSVYILRLYRNFNTIFLLHFHVKPRAKLKQKVRRFNILTLTRGFLLSWCFFFPKLFWIYGNSRDKSSIAPSCDNTGCFNFDIKIQQRKESTSPAPADLHYLFFMTMPLQAPNYLLYSF